MHPGHGKISDAPFVVRSMAIHRGLDHGRGALAGWTLGVLVSLAGCARSSAPAQAPIANETVGSRVVVDTEDTAAPIVSPADPLADGSEGLEPPPPPEAPPEPLPKEVPLPDEIVMEEPEPRPVPAPPCFPGAAPALVRGVATTPHRRPSAGPQGKRRPVRVKGGYASCDFPPIARQNGVATADVTLRVHVGPQGRVTSSTPQSNPGYDFVAAAQACLQKMRFTPALDAQGRPIADDISVVVRFRN